MAATVAGGYARPLTPLLRRYMRRTWDRNLATVRTHLHPGAVAPAAPLPGGRERVRRP